MCKGAGHGMRRAPYIEVIHTKLLRIHRVQATLQSYLVVVCGWLRLWPASLPRATPPLGNVLKLGLELLGVAARAQLDQEAGHVLVTPATFMGTSPSPHHPASSQTVIPQHQRATAGDSETSYPAAPAHVKRSPSRSQVSEMAPRPKLSAPNDPSFLTAVAPGARTIHYPPPGAPRVASLPFQRNNIKSRICIWKVRLAGSRAARGKKPKAAKEDVKAEDGDKTRDNVRSDRGRESIGGEKYKAGEGARKRQVSGGHCGRCWNRI
ncbi:hypothetical protein B0H14DRAFT_2600919 [Mycena olivaceomarginata]|nr:hypothetical protein B0H14DRAFT_2600919 [Mycena olivaceomarginata]